MGKGYPVYMKLPKLGFVTLHTRGKTQTCTLEFLWRNLILMVTWQWEVFELEIKNQVLRVLFLPLPCAGCQCAAPISPGASVSPCEMGGIGFPSCPTLMLNSSMYAKTGDLSGKAKHSRVPLFRTWVSAVASCGVLRSWSREEDYCRSVSCLSQQTNPFDNCKGMGWIITILIPTLFLKTFFFFFSSISCFILLDQSLSYPCTRNVLRLAGDSLPHGCVQQWHSTQVSVVFGSWLCHSCSQTHWTWAGSPHQLVVSLSSL